MYAVRVCANNWRPMPVNQNQPNLISREIIDINRFTHAAPFNGNEVGGKNQPENSNENGDGIPARRKETMEQESSAIRMHATEINRFDFSHRANQSQMAIQQQ